MIKTKEGRILIGHVAPRAATDTEEIGGETVVIMNQYSRGEASSYRKDPAGSWVKDKPKEQRRPSSLKALKKDAQARLEAVVEQKRAADRQGKTKMPPIDVEGTLWLHADRLDDTAHALERAQAESKQSGHEIKEVIQDLRNASTKLRKHGEKVRIQMTETQEPAADRLQYLLEKGVVSIKQVEPFQDGLFKDFAIIDEDDGEPIWYAHFHYPRPLRAEDDFPSFDKAHLKIGEQRYHGAGDQMRQEKRGEKIRPILRSLITPSFASRWFKPHLTKL